MRPRTATTAALAKAQACAVTASLGTVENDT